MRDGHCAMYKKKGIKKKTKSKEKKRRRRRRRDNESGDKRGMREKLKLSSMI